MDPSSRKRARSRSVSPRNSFRERQATDAVTSPATASAQRSAPDAWGDWATPTPLQDKEKEKVKAKEEEVEKEKEKDISFSSSSARPRDDGYEESRRVDSRGKNFDNSDG